MQFTCRDDQDFALIEPELRAAGLDGKSVFDRHDDLNGIVPVRWIEFCFDIIIEHDKPFIFIFHCLKVIVQMLNHMQSLLCIASGYPFSISDSNI